MNEKILLVEDDPMNMRLLKLALKGKGYQLQEAADGQSAVDMITLEPPDFIVLDIQLPRVSGLDVARRVRGETATKSIPILAVTAYAMKGDKNRIIAAGCDAYMSKPVNTHELAAVVAQMLAQRPS